MRRRLLWLLGLSLLLHLAVLALPAWRAASLPGRPAPLAVRLLPPAPVRPVAAVAPPTPSRVSGKAGRAAPIPRAAAAAAAPSSHPSSDAPASPAASVDLGAAMATARQIGRAGAAKVAPGEASGERGSALGRKIEQAARSDCRDAYAGLGLLAIPFLAANAVSERGCKW